MWCSLRSLARTARLLEPSHFTIKPTFLRENTCRAFSVTTRQSVGSAEMGKEKVQFQLKTPKGTKDCKPQAVNVLLETIAKGL